MVILQAQLKWTIVNYSREPWGELHQIAFLQNKKILFVFSVYRLPFNSVKMSNILKQMQIAACL